MPNFTAADVKRLREKTGAGMLDTKKALEEADGDFEKAVELLRIKGAKDVGKRAERVTANGLVAHHGHALVELNAETDFVAKNDQFLDLADKLVKAADQHRPANTEELLDVVLEDGNTVASTVESASAVIGEKIAVGRVGVLDGQVVAYMHKRNPDLPAQVGVLVSYTGEGETAESAARAAAMQIAAMRPKYLSREDIPEEVVANERRIAEETARAEGKPEAAMPKIVEGRVTGFFKDVVLLDQNSVQENKKSVKARLEEDGAMVTGFIRFEVGTV